MSLIRGLYRPPGLPAREVNLSVAGPEGQLDVRGWVTTPGGVIVPARGDANGRAAIAAREGQVVVVSLAGTAGGTITYAPSSDGYDLGDTCLCDVQVQTNITIGGTAVWSADWSVDRITWRPIHETGAAAGALLNRNAVAAEARTGDCVARYVRAWINVGVVQGAGTYFAFSARART